jgi:hypothetical protein
MAKKKEPSVQDSLNYFKEVMKRSSLTNYVYVNDILLSKNPKDVSILIISDKTLWLSIVDDPDLKPNIRELNISDPVESALNKIMSYANDINDSAWVEINPEAMMNGETVEIMVKDFSYKIPINKGLIPVKLKKAEYNGMAYRVYPDKLMMGLKKKFEGVVEDTSFTMMRIFHVI